MYCSSSYVVPTEYCVLLYITSFSAVRSHMHEAYGIISHVVLAWRASIAKGWVLQDQA